jgi:hypothetical protein
MELFLQIDLPDCRSGLDVTDEMDRCSLFLGEVDLYRDTFSSDHGANLFQDREDRLTVLAATDAFLYSVNVLA